MSATVLHGDCRDVMATMDAASVDAIVCDPPYGLGFMGKGWDHGVPGVEFWAAALRVAKPGAYLVAFGGTRTYHRLACAIEDAGWEVHDCLSWLYGSGFPKHASKLKPGWEPAILARKPAPRATPLQIDACRIGTARITQHGRSGTAGTSYTLSAEPAGREWSGRWPANVVLSHDPACVPVGTRAVRATAPMGRPSQARVRGNDVYGPDARPRGPEARHGNGDGTETVEAWDCAPDCPVAMLDAQSGERGSFLRADVPGKDGGWPGGTRTVTTYGDTGGASRFYYVAKASRKEREAGLDGFAERTKRILNGGIPSAVNSDARGMAGGGDRQARNHHPTVKPLALMRWLVRLVTPPGGLVLDPFTGSGSTGVACVQEGLRFVGIEREAEYVAIAEARLAHAQPSLAGVA